VSPASLDAVIAAIADVQHGVVARWQLVELGFSAGALARRLQNGRLREVHRGVYAVGHRHLTSNGLAMAAVLACGEGAFISLNSAAARRDLRRAGQSRFDVTVPHGRRPRRPGITVHYTRTLHPEDVSLLDGIPTATVPRILVDLAGVLSEDKLKNVVEQAHRLEVFDLHALDRAIARAPNRRGLARLHRVVEGYRPSPFLRSQLEHEVHDALARRDLPPHGTNQMLGDIEVDVWFEDSRLAIQIDTRDYHDFPDQFETDRSDDIKLTLLWCRPIRITGKRWREERERVLGEIDRLSRLPPPAGYTSVAP
jgi:hypothetical protein